MEKNKNVETGLKIAYSGVEGAFAHLVAKKTFPNDELCAYSGFEEAYDSVINNECDIAVLPIENSYTGEVGQVVDLMMNKELKITKIVPYKISQNLLGIKGATLADIKKVISHSQALVQCEGYIRKHKFEETIAPNTAMAAKEVAHLGDKHLAAIASIETADIYGLEVLHKNINEMHDNTTRFGIFQKEFIPLNGSNISKNFILIFTVNNIAGALAKAISVISEHNFNMKVLRSRPSKQKAWEYYFYVEAEGDIDTISGKKMINDLSEVCNIVKIVGKYI